MTATADLSSPRVGASPPAVLRSKNGARIYKQHMKAVKRRVLTPDSEPSEWICIEKVLKLFRSDEN